MKVKAGGSWNSTVNSWVKINGQWYEFGGGAAGFAEIESSTISAASTYTYTGTIPGEPNRDSESYKILRYEADTTITFSKSGIIDVLCVGAGGIHHGQARNGEGAPGGGGGIHYRNNVYVEKDREYLLDVGAPGGGYVRNNTAGNSNAFGVVGVAGAPGSGYYNRSAGGGACGGAFSNDNTRPEQMSITEPGGGMEKQGFVGSADNITLTRGGTRGSRSNHSAGAGPSGDSGGGWTPHACWGGGSTVYSPGAPTRNGNGTGSTGYTGAIFIRVKDDGNPIRATRAKSTGKSGLQVGFGSPYKGDNPEYAGKTYLRKIAVIPDDITNEKEAVEYAKKMHQSPEYPDDVFAVGDYLPIGGILHNGNQWGDDFNNKPHDDFKWDDNMKRWLSPQQQKGNF